MTPEYRARLIADEGRRLLAYDDATGAPLRPGYKLVGQPTIGVGRCLSTRGISDAEADALLAADIAEIESRLAALPYWRGLNDARRFVLVSVAFNTGSLSNWPKMLAAVARGDWPGAADELLNSKVARDLPARYGRLAETLKTGV